MNQRPILLLFGLIFSLLAPAFGQQQGQTAPSQPIVQSITIEYLGVPNVSEEKIRANIALRVGRPYDPVLVDRSLRRLNETGLFDLYYFEPRPVGDNRVDVVLVVQTRFFVRSVEFEGNSEYSTGRIRRNTELMIKPFAPLSDFAAQSDVRAITNFYRERGYTEARVDYRIVRDEAEGVGDVIFTIDEGARIGIRRISFTGNDAIPSSELRDAMTTKVRSFWNFSWLTGSGRFRPDVFRDDLVRIKDVFRNAGFLDVEIPEDQIKLDYPDPADLYITIPIVEGRRYRTGTIEITGNTIFSTEELTGLLRLHEGDFFSPAGVDEDRQRLADHYGRTGRLETRVIVERIPNLDTGDIDLRYRIVEGEVVYVEGLNIEGNIKTRTKVILRELALAPGDVFDTVRMRTSQNRLRGTRFFDSVELSPEPTQIPNRRNLRIDVTEGRTGALTFGAGFSTLENIVVFAELTQGNFDLFNASSYFQGAGQKFRLRLALGDRTNEIILAFEEPWFMEQQLAVGFEIYRVESRFVSVLYNELRQGFEVYVRKPLFELVDGRVFYRLEEVKIFNVADDAPEVFKREEGSRLVSKVGFSLVRDTRDNLLIPTGGSRYEISTEYAGVGGDVDYFKLEGRAAQYWKIFDYGEQVFSVLGRAGSLWETGDRDIPLFDRFFLGGPNTLRGFRFRDVGPKEDREPIGGNSYFFWSAEHSIRLAEPLRFAVFYDGGFVNSGSADFDPGGYNDNFGVGLRVMLLGAPMRLDLGFPLTTDDFNSRGAQFYFSFGTRF